MLPILRKAKKFPDNFFAKKEATFEEADEFDDTTIRGVKGFDSTDSKQG